MRSLEKIIYFHQKVKLEKTTVHSAVIAVFLFPYFLISAGVEQKDLSEVLFRL
jgi:hypothetical protein